MGQDARDMESLEPLMERQNGGNCSTGTCQVPERFANTSGDTKGVLASLFTILISLPALLGSCCWPLLLAGLFSISATAAAKAFAHSISFGVTLALLTNLVQYVAWRTPLRSGSHWHKFGPLYLVSVAVPLIMADLTRHVLQDSGIWPSPGSDMYRPDCPHSERRFGGITCLSTVGVVFTICFTYAGFACLIAGVLMGVDFGSKMWRSWRLIRHGR